MSMTASTVQPGPRLRALIEEPDGLVVLIASDGVEVAGGSLWTAAAAARNETYLADCLNEARRLVVFPRPPNQAGVPDKKAPTSRGTGLAWSTRTRHPRRSPHR